MAEYISRQAVIDALENKAHLEWKYLRIAMPLLKTLETIPTADVVPTEPQEIGYDQCANAMLKMWIDNVVTDGEYNRIMDRLNKLYFSGGEKKE